MIQQLPQTAHANCTVRRKKSWMNRIVLNRPQMKLDLRKGINDDIFNFPLIQNWFHGKVTKNNKRKHAIENDVGNVLTPN